MRRRLVALGAIGAVFLIAVIAIAGGGDDDEPPVTTVDESAEPAAGSQSKSDFIKQADALCEEANAALETLAAQAGGDPAASAPEQTQLAESQLDQLQSLPPPQRDQQALDRFLRALEDEVTALEGRALALERGDDAALAEVDASLATAEADAQAAAEQFGFKVCGDPEASPDVGTEGAEETAPAPTEAVPTPEPEPVVPETGEAAPGDTGDDTGGVSPGSGGVSP